MLKLNIGCGNLPLAGYKNIDISPTANADEFYDIIVGLREDDETVEEINAGCVLEQIESNNDFVHVMNECHRVLVAGGMLKGYVPSTDPSVLFLDPVDKRFFQVGTFDYFDKSKHHWNEFGRNYGFKGWSSSNAEKNEHGIIYFTLIK